MAVQQGVHYGPGDRPPDHFRLVVVNVAPSTTTLALHQALTELWAMLLKLRQGVWADLGAVRQGEQPVTVPGGDLSLLIGYGRRLFDARVHRPQLVDRALLPSDELCPDLAPNSADLPFGKLKWREGSDVKRAQGDICLQFLGSSELAVERAVLETGELIRRNGLPLSIAAAYRGFHRDDRRSWIGFHDGVNNLSRDERAQLIPALPSLDHPWTEGGTYLTFLRIVIDLAGWRQLSREQQESIVGRDKLSGAPIESITIEDGKIVTRAMQGCPFNNGMGPMPDQEPSSCLTGAPTVAPFVVNSHIHRSNLQRGDPQQDANNRLYRQGYEFLEVNPDGSIDVGLNFVAFARSNKFVEAILTTNAWLGDANFGGGSGEPAIPSPNLMSLVAGARFAVPKDELPFPGAGLLSTPLLVAANVRRRPGR